jgi:hypothetical protein
MKGQRPPAPHAVPHRIDGPVGPDRRLREHLQARQLGVATAAAGSRTRRFGPGLSSPTRAARAYRLAKLAVAVAVAVEREITAKRAVRTDSEEADPLVTV